MNNNNYTPPPFVERFQYKNCEQINDPATRKRFYQTPDGERLPSVTTIIDKTSDKTHLIEWRKRIGEEKARQITSEAAGVGTAMHANLERFIIGEQRQPGNNPVHVQAHKMADVIIENGLKDVSEIWALEQSLYFPGLYSGTTDAIGVYKGNPIIFDYKQTNKPKKEEWVENYKVQLIAYILAHNEVYGTDIREGHVFMCSRDFQYQQFDLLPKDFNKYQDQWLTRVEQYYKSLNG
jgi:penicillin-binding protein-related factor A (putative recombinase)